MKPFFRGLSLFALGLLVGGGVTYSAFTRHLVRADDGWHCVPNGGSSLAGCYADVRSWTPADWAGHPQIARALVNAGKGDVVVRTSADGMFERIMDGDRMMDRR